MINLSKLLTILLGTFCFSINNVYSAEDVQKEEKRERFTIIFDQDWLNIENPGLWRPVVVSIVNPKNPSIKTAQVFNLQDLINGVSLEIPANEFDVIMTVQHPTYKFPSEQIEKATAAYINIENPKANYIYTVYRDENDAPADKSINAEELNVDLAVTEEPLSELRNLISKTITKSDVNWQKTPPGLTGIMAAYTI